ncbi:YslB family protein [Rossellomorea aquimaris]|uniref:YslB family protein n=1 Tax=Rossellomorea aquimaris TaxID=189382 RepID=UPI001CD2E724|nr:YslB family protein [Rossellomorea aquimaris]MCA1056366.1 YslB family protein [Rossellomorea aquimaris]
MEQKNEEIYEPDVPIFGYELIRDILLPEVLGKHTPEILYWGGKQLSRKFTLQSMDECTSFFDEAGWGRLSVTEQKKNEMTFELRGPLVERRLSMKTDASFKLEAGFLAEQLQLQKKCITEAADEIHKRSKYVKITARWDDKDKVE